MEAVQVFKLLSCAGAVHWLNLRSDCSVAFTGLASCAIQHGCGLRGGHNWMLTFPVLEEQGC